MKNNLNLIYSNIVNFILDNGITIVAKSIDSLDYRGFFTGGISLDQRYIYITRNLEVSISKGLSNPNIEKYRPLPYDYLNIDEFLNDKSIIDFHMELIYICHEYGHYISNKNLKRPSNYDNIFELYNKYINNFDDITMSKEDKKIIIDEEIRAWKFARKLLVKYYYKNWNYFYKIRKKCLKSYNDSLYSQNKVG